MPNEDEIRQRAHAIWEQEGRPEGRQEEHWHRASTELGGAGLSMDLDKGTITPDGQPATAPADDDGTASAGMNATGTGRRSTSTQPRR